MRFARHIGVALLVLSFLTGCNTWDYDGPNTQEMRSTFADHRSAFDQLNAMLREDRRCANDTSRTSGSTITVGSDMVCDFWADESLFGFGQTRWSNIGISSPQVQDATRAEMLEEVGLSDERYKRYLALLDTVNAQRATFTHRSGRSPEVSLWVGGEGWVASSYYVDIVHRSTPPDKIVEDVFAYMEREGYGTYRVYSELGDGWFVELDMQW
jgi:hypothetical protein